MPLRLDTFMPEFDGASDWINADQPDPRELLGHPTLVYFWSISCDICHANLPALIAWRDKFGLDTLQMVSVHVPRHKEDLDEARILQQKSEFQISEPLALDDHLNILKAFQVEFLPCFFLFDSNGKLIRRASGNNGISRIENKIQELFQPQ